MNQPLWALNSKYLYSHSNNRIDSETNRDENQRFVFSVKRTAGKTASSHCVIQ